MFLYYYYYYYYNNNNNFIVVDNFIIYKNKRNLAIKFRILLLLLLWLSVS